MKRRRFCVLFKKEEPGSRPQSPEALARCPPLDSRAPFLIPQSHLYSHYFSPKHNPSLNRAAVCLTVAAWFVVVVANPPVSSCSKALPFPQRQRLQVLLRRRPSVVFVASSPSSVASSPVFVASSPVFVASFPSSVALPQTSGHCPRRSPRPP